MCGIGGFVSSEYTEQDLKKMQQSLRHRGPDAQHSYFKPEFGLGLMHTRLSIIDLAEHANQPMISSNGRFVIVFNGEIYNFLELKQELDYPFKTNSDTEVLLALYIKYGDEMVDKLNGMFAIAIWDNDNHSMSLFRDRLGIKPLYYFWEGKNFLFASELKAIKAVIKTRLVISQDAMRDYLHLGYIPEPLSIYENIYKFPSASKGQLKQGELKITKYWDAAKTLKYPKIVGEKQSLLQLKTTLEAAVDRRLVSDVPLGTFLSGGIDSSLITAIASQKSSEKLNTFSIGFEEAHKNEAPYAAEVAQYLGTEHHEFIVSQNKVKELIPSLMDVYDEPYADSSAFPTMIVSGLARSSVTVALSGDGGDELFHGYGAYQWANRLAKLGGYRHPIKTVLRCGDQRKQRAAQVFDYRKKDNVEAHIFSQEQYLFSAAEISALCNQEYVFSNSLVYPNQIKNLSADQQAFFDLNYYLKDDLLVKVDRASMRYGLEARVPLLDHTVVELALQIDSSLKMKDGAQKYLLKQLLFSYVPKELFDRPKAGFSIPLQQWLKSDLSYLIDHYLFSGNLEELGLDVALIMKLVEDFRQGKDYLYNRIWQLIVLSMWYEKQK